MDVNDFPAPYDLEVLRCIGEARGELSPEAIVVLKRHGESLGTSDEVLEMTVEMPEEEPPPSKREV